MATQVESSTHMEYAVVGGSTSEALGGLAAAVLAIIGLSGIAPGFMVTIAAIVLGVALLFQGGFVAAEFRRLMAASGSTDRTAQVELGGGLGSEALAGAAAVVLGILALLGLAAGTLVSVSNIVLGAGILLGSGVVARLNEVRIAQATESAAQQRLAHEAVTAANTLQVLVGIAAVVLGILSLIGVSPLMLNLIAQLAIGSAIVLSGTAITGRVLSVFGT